MNIALHLLLLVTMAHSFAGQPDDPWRQDEVLRSCQRIQDGEHFGVLLDILASNDVTELWSTPEVLHEMLNVVPILRTLKGLDAIAAKDVHDVTSEDGLKALGFFKEMLQTMASATQTLSSPKAMLKKLQEYSTTKDKKLRRLLQEVRGGSKVAMQELQRLVAQREMGDILDLDKLGWHGGEAPISKQLREAVFNDDLEIFKLITEDDPDVERFLKDPVHVASKAVEIMADSEATIHHEY